MHYYRTHFPSISPICMSLPPHSLVLCSFPHSLDSLPVNFSNRYLHNLFSTRMYSFPYRLLPSIHLENIHRIVRPYPIIMHYVRHPPSSLSHPIIWLHIQITSSYILPSQPPSFNEHSSSNFVLHSGEKPHLQPKCSPTYPWPRI
jgi:hypothetical protein